MLPAAALSKAETPAGVIDRGRPSISRRMGVPFSDVRDRPVTFRPYLLRVPLMAHVPAVKAEAFASILAHGLGASQHVEVLAAIAAQKDAARLAKTLSRRRKGVDGLEDLLFDQDQRVTDAQDYGMV